MEEKCFFIKYEKCLGDGKLMKSGLQRIKKASGTRLDSEILTGIKENFGNNVSDIKTPEMWMQNNVSM